MGVTEKQLEELVREGDNAMNFQNAVEAMKLDVKVRRLSWPEGHCMFVDDGRVAMYVGTKFQGVPLHQEWMPTLEDFEAEDWFVIV